MVPIKILLVAVLTFLCAYGAVGQIGLTRTEIKANSDCEFEEGVPDEGDLPFMYCIKKHLNADGDTYSAGYCYYFDKETRQCVGRKVLEPLSEINAWVKMCNKEYVSIGKMRWHDYATNITVSIKTDDTTVHIFFFWDNEE